jgi:CubicO group peptidase (beta-lactamase class C family)
MGVPVVCEIRKCIQEWQDQPHGLGPGVSVAVARRGEEPLILHEGYADRERKVRPCEDTVYHFGSMGKTALIIVWATLRKQPSR